MPAAPAIEGEPVISQDGGSVLCECAVKADPKPEAAWKRDDKEIKAGDEYTMTVTEEKGKFRVVCEIKNFAKTLAGIYKVDLKNSAGATSATFTVSAGDAPEMVGKPKIVQRDGGAILGIKITCTSKTEPKADWAKDDKAVKEDDHIKLKVEKLDKDKPNEYTFRLEINGPQKTDEGKYRCVIKNAEGSNSQSLDLAFD